LQEPLLPYDENLRLSTLHDLNILDTPAEERFDRLTRLAQQLLGMPIALVSLVDQHRQWFKSCQGLEASETPRSVSFCGHAILDDKLFIVQNTLEDSRFADNPLVTEAPHIRFYAGQPLKGNNGQRMGTLCVIDSKPRDLNQTERECLKDLAILVENELNSLERDGAVKALKNMESRLNGVIDHVRDAIITISENGAIYAFNKSAEKIFGYSTSESAGLYAHDLIPSLGKHENYVESFLAFNQKKTLGSESEVLGQRKNGSAFPMELSVTHVEIDDAKYFITIIRDISQRKVFEQQIVDEKQQLSAVIDHVVDGIISISARGMIESFNPAARNIFGYSNEEVIGQNVKMLMPEPYHSEHDGYLHNHVTTGEKKVIGIGREVTGRRKDGSTFPMELAVSEVLVNEERHFVGITRDITERKAFEQKILEEKKQLSAVIDHIVDGIITIGERGTIESFNPAARNIFGYSNEEVIGQNVKMLMPEPYHSEHDGYLHNHVTTGEKKVIGIGREVTGRRKDGSTFPMELAVNEVMIDNKRHFVGITRDITERKRVEQMQKEFISTVSHELRTPLTSIRGSLGLILGGVTGELPEKAKSLLAIANNNSERLIHLINDILDMEKMSSGKMHFDYSVTDLAAVVQLAVDSNKGYGDELHVHFKFNHSTDEKVTVRIDEKRMAQVMSNLLSNAAKYSPQHGTINISLNKTEEQVRISVHDDGKGIPEEFKSRIFSKFAQADSSDTRQKGGTGLGLNITKAIVEEHGGSIGFESLEGQGTTFYVDIPLWFESSKVVKDKVKTIAIATKPLVQSRVLIIEDDKDVSKLLSMMLESHGYDFHQAYDCEEAIECIKNNHYDAITLDLMIPGGCGLTLLRKLRADEETKGLPVIVVSAKAVDGKLEVEGDGFNMVDWIEKPIDENMLLESVRVATAQARSSECYILHVEDDPDIAIIVDSLLGGECKVVHAETLAQAKLKLREQAFDLVLLDIGLPDGSGLDLLPMLNSPEHQSPVVIFSAQDVSADISAQVTATLVKSKTDNEKLMQQIKTAINK